MTWTFGSRSARSTQRRQFQRGVGDDRVALVGAVERDSRDAVGDLVGHGLQVVEVDGPDRRARHPLTSARSMIGARSSPVGQGAERPAPVAAPAGWPGTPRRPRGGRAAPAASPAGRARCPRRSCGRGTGWSSSVAELSPQRVDVGVQPRVVPGGAAEFVEQHLDALGPGCHGAQRVQRADVARALPDAHQRRLPVQPRHAGVLDVAVAAEALHRLGGVRGGALADPVLGGGQADAAQQGLAFVAADGARRWRRPSASPAMVAASASTARSASTLRISGWSIRYAPNAFRCWAWWMARVRPGAHAGGAAERAVQPGQVDHLDDGRHAAALLADQPRGGAVVLDLARGVGVVAELVLEPLQEHPVAGAVGQDPRQEEAGQPAGRLRQHQEHVAHRRRGEPLVPGQACSCRRRSASRAVVPARTSEPPCFSVIDMPAVRPALVAGTSSSGS